jgi:putative transposase
VLVAQLCREHGMSDASFYKWRAKYSGIDASIVGQMKAMDGAIGSSPMARENRRLKRMYADPSMQNDLLKEILGKK